MRENYRIRRLMQGFADAAGSDLDEASIDFHFVYDRASREDDDGNLQRFFWPNRVVIYIKHRRPPFVDDIPAESAYRSGFDGGLVQP